MRHNFYHIPKSEIKDTDLPIRYVAIYQSKAKFGAESGIYYYGEVTRCIPMRRSEIREIPSQKGEVYYRFEIKEWKRLSKPIAPKELGFVKCFTNLFLLEHSADVPELLIRTEEEYRLYVTLPLNHLNTAELDKMVLSMREERLSASSINSYTRTLKVFFSWCNEEGHTDLNIKIFKAPETVKEVYTDEELLILLKKPEANCNFCEYQNWVIINFLLNSGCRAVTVRNIQNQDVDLSRKQIVLRHTKNGKVQVIPLCSAEEIGVNIALFPP